MTSRGFIPFKQKTAVPVREESDSACDGSLALLGGKFFGLAWLDPVMGIGGSVLVASWAVGLLRDTSGILLDRTPDDTDLGDEIRKTVEADGDSRIADLHIWRLAPERFAAIISVVGRAPLSAEEYREKLREHEELVHVTIEVIRYGVSPLSPSPASPRETASSRSS